jgi:LCP family protein required for cell wall assembly
MRALAIQDSGTLRRNPLVTNPAATVSTARRRSRRRVAFWVFFSFVAMIAVLAGVLTWQIIDTLGTVNSASTPPPMISGAVLGGSPEVEIDTSRARTAVAISELDLTATPIPTATSTIAATSTASSTTEPTATATATLVNVVGAVTIEPSPALEVDASATPKPAGTETAVSEADEDYDLPTEIDVPVDNLTATPLPIATETAVSEADEDYDLPTEIDVPIDNLTATPKPEATLETAKVTESPSPEETASIEVTPEATVLSEIERVENGSFEEGVNGWYLESGAGPVVVDDAPDGTMMLQIPVTGAYADQGIFTIPGTSYYLSGTGRLTADGDSGVIGVVYQDAQENRLSDLEPDPITFTSTRMTQKGMTFTPPAEVVNVKVYAYKDDGPAALEVDAISVRSIVPPYVEGGSTSASPELAEGSMTILIMGVDAREGEAIDGGVRPDSLMVVHLNPDSSACRVLSIPRDTRTELPGYGLTKVNHALAVGGIDYEVQVVSDLIDLPIDHYVLIDFSGFEDLVDAIGGVTITVPETFTALDGTEFVAGEQRITGKQALSYARHRSDAEGDFGRIDRQQKVIRALIRELGGRQVLTSIKELLPAVQNNIRTDLSVSEMIDIADTYRSICTEEAVTMLKLQGEIATFDDPLLQMPLSYVVVDEAEIRRKVAALLEP